MTGNRRTELASLVSSGVIFDPDSSIYRARGRLVSSVRGSDINRLLRTIEDCVCALQSAKQTSQNVKMIPTLSHANYLPSSVQQIPQPTPWISGVST